MKRMRIVISMIFLMALAITVIAFNANKPRLLILHSYDKEYSWTRDVDIGLRRGLQGAREYSLRWFYMDTKRHPWKDYKVNSGRAAQKVVRTWQPNVVIAVDDDAHEFAMQHFAGQQGVKIVFAGLNSEKESYGYERAANVTGILERKPYRALKETLQQIADARSLQRPLRIFFLGDNSESVRQDAEVFSKFDWSPVEVLGKRFAVSFEDWKKYVQEAESLGADFIITANYRKIAKKEGGKALMPHREVVRWTEENSHVPVVGTNAFYVEDGGMLAVATSPYEQGEVAAAMALQILRKGVTPSTIPTTSTQQFVIAMRAQNLRKRGIALPAVYEAAARASANYYP